MTWDIATLAGVVGTVNATLSGSYLGHISLGNTLPSIGLGTTQSALSDGDDGSIFINNKIRQITVFLIKFAVFFFSGAKAVKT